MSENFGETAFHALEKVPLADVVKEEYRNYQIYSLMDRAIPHLQDGLKPVQRRILFTLWKNQGKGLMKVSSATGLVLTVHPHGPQSIESAMVNLAQDFTFSNNYPLIDKKGYFGERMEQTPAAGRYIECKLGKISELLLFDDMNQVQMVPNYDEKVMEPLNLYPKLPIMLLNGAEGIGTGFSSVIPSFHHKDIIDSMISFIQKGKTKKLKPYVHYYSEEIETDDKHRLIFKMKIEEKDGKFFITELPRGFDSQRVYRHLSKFLDDGYIKDFIDASVDNHINIELVFKRGETPTLEGVQKHLAVQTSIIPNYTLISERGVKIFDAPEQIIEIFTKERIRVVQRRYELLSLDYEQRINQNNEIIRFIKEKHYTQAEKSENRKSFIEYLSKKNFVFTDYLADMAIYRMTKEEVRKRELLVEQDSKALKEYKKIAKSDALVREKLIEELEQVRGSLNEIMKQRDKEKEKQYLISLAKEKEKKKRSSSR